MPKINRQQKLKKNCRHLSFAFAFDLFLIAVVAIMFTVSSQTFAATHNITGGTYGSACNSGGYFTPSALTVNSGDTVTISVPSNDPYAGGIEVHGFPEGNFTIPRGGQHTTQTLTADVSYYGTWPSTGCPKGTGTITVSHPSSPTPTPPSTSHPSPTTTPSSTSSSESKQTTTKHPSPAPSSGKTHESTTSDTPTTNGKTADTSIPAAGAATQTVSAENTSSKSSTARKSVGMASLVLAVGLTGWIAWRYVVKPKKL